MLPKYYANGLVHPHSPKALRPLLTKLPRILGADYGFATSRKEGKNPFQLDSEAPSITLKQYAYQEARYSMLARSDPEGARKLLRIAQDDVNRNWYVYQNRAAAPARQPMRPEGDEKAEPATNAAAKGGEEQ